MVGALRAEPRNCGGFRAGGKRSFTIRATCSMAKYDFSAQRLFVDAPLGAGAVVALDRAQANYALSVLRMRDGDELLLFNGRDGEWRARIEASGRKAGNLHAVEQTRAQAPAPDLHLLFAPLKHARLDYMVQKAVEMGAGMLQPVFTRRTQAGRVNLERMRAHAIEAAGHGGVLALPAVLEGEELAPAITRLPPERILVFCDEEAPEADPVAALRAAAPEGGRPPCAIVIGPEGGFAPEERALILGHRRGGRLARGAPLPLA